CSRSVRRCCSRAGWAALSSASTFMSGPGYCCLDRRSISGLAQPHSGSFRNTASSLVALLRGFVSGSRWLALTTAMLIAGLAAACVWLIQPWLTPQTVIPLYLACVTIPAYALANVQEGIAHSYDWVGLSMMPVYVVRQLLLTVLIGLAYVAGLPMDAVT